MRIGLQRSDAGGTARDEFQYGQECKTAVEPCLLRIERTGWLSDDGINFESAKCMRRAVAAPAVNRVDQ